MDLLKKKECVSNLLETRDILTESVHFGFSADVVYTDFAKAFDKVPHRRLLHKLRAYGIHGSLHKWIESWLTNRQQRVQIDECSSGWKTVTSGVPQGSVLGPLLFVLYINDLPDKLVQHVKLFADDSKIIGVITSEEDCISLQKDIDEAVQWSHKWLMPFNIDKCKVMHVGRTNRKSKFIYSMLDLDGNRKHLEVTTVERDLGVLVSDDLKTRSQVNAAAALANRTLGRLKKLFRSRSLLLWKILYKAYIRPHLEYAVQAWSPHFRRDIDTLEKVQHRVTKTITMIKHLTYEERLHRLGISTLEERRIRGDLIQQYKILTRLDEIDFFVVQKQPKW